VGPSYRAVIFDMDGVLTDSEPAFYAAVNDVLADYGHHIGVDEYAPLIGSATPHTWNTLRARFGIADTLEQVLERYEPLLMRRLREPRPALPGARDLIETLRERGVPVGLCTASYTRWVDAILPAAGLDGVFDALSTADMVERTKPDPAPFALAARKLCFAPEECVAIEDSRNGLASAMGAGCYTIQLRATETAAPPMPGVARIIHSLAEFPLEILAPGQAKTRARSPRTDN
jgi:HAD superfamily hydrolase (TIGR01509 family)